MTSSAISTLTSTSTSSSSLATFLAFLDQLAEANSAEDR